MDILRRILNSFFFWSAWIIIPLIMEIIPAVGSVFMLIRRRRKENRTQKDPTVWPEISLIVPVYNSEDTLYKCIESVENSTYPDEDIRIYLVNNGSSDRSFEIYKKCQDDFPDLAVQWMNAEQGKSRALNMALYNAEGKYIINIDSDGMLEKSALKNMIRKFENEPDLNVMTGAIMTMPWEIKKYTHFFPRLLRNCEFMEYAQAFLAGRSYASDINSIYTLSGAFSAFRKSAVLASRMYNTGTISEDTQLTFQMRYLYHEKIEICESAIFFVEPIESFNKLYVQRQRWQRGSLEVAKMFGQKKLRLFRMFKDTNVHTLVFDHTFAFPRMIWYLALILLTWLNYSGMTVLYAFLLIFLLYMGVGYLYFFSVKSLLKKMPEIRKYYVRHWWVVAILPFFNLLTFFIRLAGIINSAGTDSMWRTRDLTDERHAFIGQVRQDAGRVRSAIQKARDMVNND